MNETQLKQACGLLRERKEALDLIGQMENFSARGLVRIFGERADGKENSMTFNPTKAESEAIHAVIRKALNDRLANVEFGLSEHGVSGFE